MIKKLSTASALGLICLMAAGCVSEGGSHVAYDSGPRYDRINRHDRSHDRDRDRRDRDDRRDVRSGDDRRDRDDRWDGRRGDDGKQRGGNRDRDTSSRNDGDRDGRWMMRDGRRIWVPERR